MRDIAALSVGASQGLNKYWWAVRMARTSRFGLGLAGENDAHGFGVEPLYLGQQLRAIHTRHSHVRHHDVGGLRGEFLESRRGAVRETHVPLVTHAMHAAAYTLEYSRFIIDKQDANHRPALFRLERVEMPLPGSLDCISDSPLDGAGIRIRTCRMRAANPDAGARCWNSPR